MAKIYFIIFCIYYFASNFAESHSTGRNNNKPNLPVCVVGAGFSGINLGILLQEKGYEVHVFEKHQRVGGKVETFTIRDEVLVEMCPLFYLSTESSLQKYIHQFQFTSVPFNQTDVLAFDPNSGVILPFPLLITPLQQQQLEIAIKQFIYYRSQYTNEFDFGYLHATPDLFDSMDEWLIKRKLTALKPMFELVFTVQGYGALQDIPALFMLKLFSVDFLKGQLNPSGSFFTLYEGLYNLVRKMASLLKNLYLNRELIALVRNNGYQEIFLKNGYAIERRICGQTILAFPPLLSNLQSVILDLSYFEKSVLNQVKITKYATAAHHLPSLDHNLYAEGFKFSANRTPIAGAPMGNGEVTAFVKQSTRKLQNVYTSYSWVRGDYDKIATNAELHQMSMNMLKTVQKISTRHTTLHSIKTTEYFPHVTPESLKKGFFKKFNSIQGNKGLYFASTVLTFEIMDEALKMTEAFVDKYF